MEIKYDELIEAFKQPETKGFDFWRAVAEIERSIPRYNNKYTWWERTINFCNTYLVEQAIAKNTVSIAGFYNIELDLNTYDNHDSFHGGRGHGYSDFYHVLSKEKTDLKIVDTLKDGLHKYAKLPLSHGSDSLILYCLDTNEYYMLMIEPVIIELDNYNRYENTEGDYFIYYKVELPEVELLAYNKPVADDTEILAGLPEYTYIANK